MIRTRQIALAIESDEGVVVVPLSVERLKRFEALAVPFEQAGFTWMSGYDTIDHRTLCQPEEMTRVEREGNPLLRREYREALQRHPCVPPKVNITLLAWSSSLQIEAIEQREIDVGLLQLPESALPTDLVFTPLMEEPLLLAVHAGHRLVDAPSIKLKDLRDEPFIAYPRQPGVAVYEQTVALCAKRGFEPQVVQEAQQASTLVGLTATGLGIALVPATLQTIAVHGVVFRHLDETDTITTLYIAHRFGDANARAMQFVELALGLRQGCGTTPSSDLADGTDATNGQARQPCPNSRPAWPSYKRCPPRDSQPLTNRQTAKPLTACRQANLPAIHRMPLAHLPAPEVRRRRSAAQIARVALRLRAEIATAGK